MRFHNEGPGAGYRSPSKYGVVDDDDWTKRDGHASGIDCYVGFGEKTGKSLTKILPRPFETAYNLYAASFFIGCGILLLIMAVEALLEPPLTGSSPAQENVAVTRCHEASSKLVHGADSCLP